MVSVTFIGLDQFIVGDVSRDITPLISKIYETSEDEVDFIAPSVMYFHNGVDQTSWNVLMIVHAPVSKMDKEEEMRDLLFNCLGNNAIHVVVEFHYYQEGRRYYSFNEDYPRFMKEDNIVNFDEEDSSDLEEGDGDEEIYTGDIFKDILKKD